MAGIEKYLNTIKNGVFGRDVRKAIHDGIEQVYNDAAKNGNANMEVAKARGSHGNLSERFNDLINQIRNIAEGSPKGTYTTLSALKSAKPTGSDGIYVTTDNGNWNYWNGTDWVAGGIYQGSSLSESEKSKLLDTVYSELTTGITAKTANFSSATASADNNLYIDGNVLKGDIKGITVRVNSSTTAELYIFKAPDTITGSHKISLVEKIQFSPSSAGEYFIRFPKYYGHNIVVGFSGSGLVYSMEGAHLVGYKTSSEKALLKLEEEITVGFSISKIQFAYSVAYNEVGSEIKVNAVKSYSEILDTSLPSYDRKYPIIFDFVSGRVIVNTLFLMKYSHAQFLSYTPHNQEIDLPMFDKTKQHDYQNYLLAFNGTDVILRTATGGKIQQTQFVPGENELATISIKVTSAKKPMVFLTSSPNRHLIKVIVNHTITEDNADQWDEVTAKVIDGGLYHYTYAALGDSITRGEDSATGYRPMLGNRYTDYVSKTTGMIVNNYGIGGTRISYTDNKKGMVTRVHQLGTADIYSVFGGTNDFASSVPLGERGSGNLSHFKPAFEQICQVLRDTGKKCFIITPIKRANTMTANKEGLTLKDYVDAEIEIARDYGIPVLNLFDSFTQTAWKSDVLRAKYMPDGLHPNPAGMKFIGEAVTKFIKQQFEFD
ncbi:SGNH/GDSL hydrolase family protein [Streptococcus suis]|nr:SGNH/GDSL hydrolase family protein [Streptococcus suis]